MKKVFPENRFLETIKERKGLPEDLLLRISFPGKTYLYTIGPCANSREGEEGEEESKRAVLRRPLRRPWPTPSMRSRMWSRGEKSEAEAEDEVVE